MAEERRVKAGCRSWSATWLRMEPDGRYLNVNGDYL
jgi:hypothetical protein